MASSYNNVVRTNGTSDAFKMNSNGSVSFPFAARGIVKDNIDTVKTGRIRVYIDDFGSLDPDDAGGWIPVSYMSPFYGLTGDISQDPSTGFGAYVNNPHSYGFWASSPDIGTEVVCVFLYGKKDFGFYIGCIPKPGLTHMVPAVASTDNLVPTDSEASSYGGAKRLPVTELNQNNAKLFDVPTFNAQPRPVHSYVAAQLFQQGLIRDNVRGTISSASSRESPSRVFGMSTPGRPIYRGISAESDEQQSQAVATSTNQQSQIISRRGGHSFVMDDGDKDGGNNLIRLRTSAGHQITMSDDGQTLFITHANGQSYVELGKEGTVDIYATNSFNVRTKGDLNFHADNNVNINAKKSLNIFAEQININSDKDTTLRTGGNFIQQTVGNFKLKVNQGMSLASGGISSFLSKTTTYINGSAINLNTGSSSLIPEDVKPLPIIMQTDSLFDSTSGWLAAPATLPSITSRTPAHAPWVNANLGVDVKINENADANLPVAPSPTVAKVTAATGTSAKNPVQTNVAVSVPANSSVSETIDKNTTATLVAQAATNAGTDPITSAAAAAGGGVVTSLDGTKSAVLGAIAHTPAQLEQGGFIKPGSGMLVDSLIAQGKTLAQAMPSALWTGKDGISDAAGYSKSIVAQTNNQVNLLQQGLAGLKSAGIVTGKESSTQIGGLVSAAAAFGSKQVADFVNQTANPQSIEQLAAVGTAISGKIKDAVSSGNFAANLADKVTNPLGSVLSSVKAGAEKLVASVKGAAASAFAAIKSGLTKLKGGIPQNLTALNQQNAAAQDAANTAATETPKSSVNFTLADAGKIKDVITKGAGILANAGIKLPVGELAVLAGGITAISKVVTNLKESGPADTTTLGASIKSAVSSVNSSKLNAESLAQGLKNAVQKGLSMTSLTGLSASAVASLNSAIKSIGSGGPLTLQMPTVAVDTINRSGILKQTAALFSDPRIPLPATTPKASTATATASAAVSSDVQLDSLIAERRQLETDLPKFKADKEAAYLRFKQGIITWDEYDAIAKKTSTAYFRLADIIEEVNKIQFG